MFNTAAMSQVKTGKRELILKLPVFYHRFVLHGRGAIVIDGAPYFE